MQGEVLGITRHGLAKLKESVLMLASVGELHVFVSLSQPSVVLYAAHCILYVVAVVV